MSASLVGSEMCIRDSFPTAGCSCAPWSACSARAPLPQTADGPLWRVPGEPCGRPGRPAGLPLPASDALRPAWPGPPAAGPCESVEGRARQTAAAPDQPRST
eukprot:7231190-Alexandrium_andersonii.AAC.1